MPIFRLDERIAFPNPIYAEEDGLLAVGGDLSKERLLLAYKNGIFPWYNPGEIIQWWCPKERFIIRPENIHVSHSMKKYMKKHIFEIRVNRDFKDTMHNCRMLREEEGTWISDEMEAAYYELHKAGYAVSVEVFIENELCGGLYGVVIGKCFFGESMFSLKENGSKVALIAWADLLKEKDFVMIDCQMPTEHLISMGGENISYKEYMDLIHKGIHGTST